MSEITTNRIEVVVERLKDLAKDRESFFNDGGDDDIFRQDHQALCEAVAILEAVKDGRVVELPEWPIPINKQIGRYRIAGADAMAKTITLEDAGREPKVEIIATIHDTPGELGGEKGEGGEDVEG